MQIKQFFKDVMYLFCCQGHLIFFFRKLFIFQKIWKWHIQLGHVNCVVMTHCVRKLICYSPLTTKWILLCKHALRNLQYFWFKITKWYRLHYFIQSKCFALNRKEFQYHCAQIGLLTFQNLRGYVGYME